MLQYLPSHKHHDSFQWSLFTHSRRDRGVVEVAGVRCQDLSVVRVFPFVPHDDFKRQFSVISADQKGSRAATQELMLGANSQYEYGLIDG